MSVFVQIYTHAQGLKEIEAQLKNAINEEKTIEKRSILIDSLLQVFNAQEKHGQYDQKDDLLRATFLFRSSAPDHFKIDTILNRALRKYEGTVGDAILLQYFANLNNCIQGVRPEERTDYRRRMLNDYVRFEKWSVNYHFSDKTMNTLLLFLDQTFHTCELLQPDVIVWMQNPLKQDSIRLGELNNFKWLLERKACQSSDVYSQVLDSLLSLTTSCELWLARANAYALKKDFSKEFSCLHFAKKLSRSEELADSISWLSASSLYQSHNFQESLKMYLSVNGRCKGKALIQAANCVIDGRKNCGETEAQQQLQFFYAAQLIHEAKKLGEHNENLENEVKSQLPSENELTKMGLKGGQNYKLDCWDKLIILRP